MTSKFFRPTIVRVKFDGADQLENFSRDPIPMAFRLLKGRYVSFETEPTACARLRYVPNTRSLQLAGARDLKIIHVESVAGVIFLYFKLFIVAKRDSGRISQVTRGR